MSSITNNPLSRVDSSHAMNEISRSEIDKMGGGALNSMASLRASFTKLIGQMRNLQQKYATQQRSTVLEFQEKGMNKQMEAIDKDKSAASKRMIGAIAGGAVSILGHGVKFGSSIKGSMDQNKLGRVESKGAEYARKLETLKKDPAKLEEYNTIAEKMKKNDKSILDLKSKIGKSGNWGSGGDVVSTFGQFGSVAGEGMAAGDTAEGGKLKVKGEQLNTIREMRRKEMDETESMARDSSQQMREAARSFNEIYNKISSAVRF